MDRRPPVSTFCRYQAGNRKMQFCCRNLENSTGEGYSKRVKRLGDRGQILIPSLFVLPTLFLFVYLLFETAKLSREKIRHQFAADAAVFVEMTNYSDFLNRSAYVNGAFPMRIFYEGFHGTPMDCVNGTSDHCPGSTSLDELLYANGAFPRSQHEPNPDSFMN